MFYEQVRRKLADKAKDGTLKAVSLPSNGEANKEAPKKRSARWDQTGSSDADAAATPAAPAGPAPPKRKTWEVETPAVARWDETPARSKPGAETPAAGGVTPGSRLWDATPGHDADARSKRNRWDETPKTERGAGEFTPGFNSGWAETPRTDRGGDTIQETPTPSASKRRSRWDETPANASGAATPSMGSMTPQTPSLSGAMTPRMTPGGATPIGQKAMAMATPTPGHLVSMTPEQIQAYRWEKEIDERNRPLGDDELDGMFPEGYKVLPPPAGYVPLRTPARKLTATPTPLAGSASGFYMQTEDKTAAKFMDAQPKGGNLPFLKPEDAQYFDKLLVCTKS